MKLPLHSHGKADYRSHKPLFLFFSLTVTAVFSTYFLYVPRSTLTIESTIKPGDIASEDIIINEDITVEDLQATAAERLKAQEGVLPVYEFHQDQIDRTISLIDDWYEVITNFRKDKETPETARVEALQKTLMDRFTIAVTQTQAKQILRSPAFHRLELDELLKKFSKLAQSGILASKISSKVSPQNRIQIQHPNKKKTVLQLEELHDLKEAKDTLATLLQEKTFTTEETSYLTGQIMEFVGSNLTYSESLTQIEQQKLVSQVNPVLIKLKAGKVVVRKGDEFQPEDIHLLSMISANQSKAQAPLPPYLIIFFSTFLLLFLVKELFGRWNSPSKNHHQAFIVFSALLAFSTIIYRLFVFLTPLILENIPYDISYSNHTLFYAIPFSFGALIVAFIFSFPHAVFFSFVNAFFGGMICGWDLHLSLYILAGNLMAALGVDFFLRLKRSTVFKSALIWVIPVQIFFAILIPIDKQGFSFPSLITNAALAFSSAMISSILAGFFIPILETGFKLVTELKLIELTNLNLPVFRLMLEKAPGTYHHSQMVASLAESAALDLNLSPLLLTAMALYHDIGKTDSPQFFTENHSVYTSPHENLTPLESARAIITHVNRGLELAAKLKLPQELTSAINQHHGSKLVKFFYDKAVENRSNGSKVDVDPSDFQYPGQKPQTIENAIIMIADQVEAASKSLSRPSDLEIKNVIEKVIESDIEENQFSECQGLTFQTLAIISSSFYKKMSSIYHMRISYPGFDFSENEAAKNA